MTMLCLRACRVCQRRHVQLDGLLVCCSLLQLEEGAAIPITPREVRLIWALFPPNVAKPTDEVIGLVWPNPEDEPEVPEESIKSWCSKLRSRLEGTRVRLGVPRQKLLELGTRGQIYIRMDHTGRMPRVTTAKVTQKIRMDKRLRMRARRRQPAVGVTL